MSALLAATAALATVASSLIAGPVAAAIPPQEPGVTLRVFDLEVPLDRICKLKPGQTPNVDKLMPGNKIDNARATVVWNGVVVHNDVEINGGTGDNIPEGPLPGPIRLQDHGDPGENPRYRNIWIEPLG